MRTLLDLKTICDKLIKAFGLNSQCHIIESVNNAGESVFTITVIVRK